MAHRPIACIDWCLGNILSSSVCDSAMSGPPAIPCSTRMPSSIGSDVDRPHRSEQAPNSTTATQKSRTAPKRPDSQPVSGTVIASATA